MTTPQTNPTGTPLADLDLEGRRWHVVVVGTKLNDHPKAVAALLARGYQVIAPLCREVITDRRDRHREVERPMFGRYVFAGSMPGQEARKLALVPSVQYVSLDTRRRALVLPVRAVAAVVARMQDGAGIVDLRPVEPVPVEAMATESAIITAPRFQPGQTVRVTDGPFAGWDALFVADEGERIRVLLSLFGRQNETSVPVRGVRAAE
ncbi:transcription termination/antitermination protein NusG [Azospirillum aestuarii]|uniref:transcription termination/antitermination protein NusG n=1 Tax=Azospirillum aestuarii TaxID=2802052 RepID=UPI0040551228